MHTFNATKTIFHYNSDFSGNVFIHTEHGQVEVPALDVLNFVAEFVRIKRISALEQASIKELLGLP